MCNLRFAKFESNHNVNKISQEESNNNYQANEHLKQNFNFAATSNIELLSNHLRLPDSKNETSFVSTLTSNSSTNSIFDLVNDAELLETSVKKNDKYTVRRILDMHFSYFRTKQYHILKKTTFNIPKIFYNILHLSIESNSLDVLRICLKYGLDSNECGVSENFETLFKFKCIFCLNKTIEMTNQIIKPDPINYFDYDHVIKLPPLFLSISKCNHQATELLLSYGACPNIQDCHDNSPLHLATAKPTPCYECIYLLLKYHANCHLLNLNRMTPIQILSQVVQEKNIEANTKWDYRMSSIYSRIIGEIFKNLELVSQPKNKANSELSQSPKNDRLFFSPSIKSTKNLNKSPTLQQNPNETCSLKNISKLTSSNSFLNENDSKNENKQIFINVKKIFRSPNSGSDANLNSVKQNKKKLKKEISEIKNLITVYEPGKKSKSLINVAPNNFISQNIDADESNFLKKYARYSRNPVSKAGSAVIRIPTFNQSIKIEKINRQTSLSNFMINKLNSIRNLNSSYPYESNQKMENFSKQISKSTDQQFSLINDNNSMISSKGSVFKKQVSIIKL